MEKANYVCIVNSRVAEMREQEDKLLKQKRIIVEEPLLRVLVQNQQCQVQGCTEGIHVLANSVQSQDLPFGIKYTFQCKVIITIVI